MPAPDPVTAHRRSVLRGAAWTAPVILVGTTAPAFALSPCPGAPFPTGWVAANPASGTLNGTAADNGYTTTYASDGINRYLSVRDNTSTALSSATANDATVTLQTTLTLTAGNPYTFSFSIASQHGSNSAATSQLQLLDITLNGTSIGKYTTQSAAPTGSTDPIKATRASGYTLLNTPNTGIAAQTTPAQSYTPTGTAGSSVSVILRYLWTLPARGYNPNFLNNPQSTYNGGSDDIAVSAPTVLGC